MATNHTHTHPTPDEPLGLRDAHRKKYADAYAVKFTLELMALGEYQRALDSAQLRLSRPCWINSLDIGDC